MRYVLLLSTLLCVGCSHREFVVETKVEDITLRLDRPPAERYWVYLEDTNLKDQYQNIQGYSTKPPFNKGDCVRVYLVGDGMALQKTKCK